MSVEEITKLEGVHSLECMIMYAWDVTRLSVNTGIPARLNWVVGPVHLILPMQMPWEG